MSFPSIDDCLGPSELRFFGYGYRRVRHVLRDGLFTQAEKEVRLSARAAVQYQDPAARSAVPQWSRGQLSAVDGLVLAVRAAEFCAAHANGLDHRQRQQSRPLRVDVMAAHSPFALGIDDFAVDTRLIDIQTPADEIEPSVSTFDCRVASTRVRVAVAHAHGKSKGSPGFREEQVPDRLLADHRPGPHGPGYRRRGQSIRHLTVDLGVGRAQAQVGFGDEQANRWTSGPGSSTGGTVSLLDSLVVAVQMGQALLYETDGVAPDRTPPLWVRRTTITSDASAPTSSAALTATIHLRDAAVVRARGAMWRTATIEGELGGIRTRCAVAHRLSAADT